MRKWYCVELGKKEWRILSKLAEKEGILAEPSSVGIFVNVELYLNDAELVKIGNYIENLEKYSYLL